jgi:DNA-directed RNA polymerase subunit beta'
MGRNMQLADHGRAGRRAGEHKLGYGSKLHGEGRREVARGDKLFEWDPYTLPIIAEKAARAKFVDLVSASRCARRPTMPPA